MQKRLFFIIVLHFFLYSFTIGQNANQQKAHDLQDVTINGFTNTLIRKAIANIPTNYGSKPFIQNGFLRIYNIINDSDYFFKGDAIVQTYFPIFKFGSKTSPQTRLLSNEKYLHIGPNFQKEDANMGSWVAGYYSVGADIFEQPDFLSIKKMNNFNYSLKNKSNINGRVIYNISFKLKKSEYLKGKLVLDSSSLAFLDIQYEAHNLEKKPKYRKIDSAFIHSQYEEINHKWYLKNSQRKSYHNYKKSNIYTIDYVRTAIDSGNVKPFGYAKIIQLDDNNALIQEENIDSLQKLNLEQYVQQGQVHNFKTPQNITTYNIDSAQSFPVSQPSNLITYLMGKNKKMGLEIGMQAFSLVDNSSINEIARYGFGTSLSVRTYKQLWVGTNFYSNYGIGHLNVGTANFYVSYQFKTNEEHRPIYFSPLTGYQVTSFEKKSHDLKYNYKNFMLGLKTSLELTHKKSVYLSTFFLPSKDSKNNADYPTKPTNFAFVIGYSL